MSAAVRDRQRDECGDRAAAPLHAIESSIRHLRGKVSAHAGFTFLTKRFPRVDHSSGVRCRYICWNQRKTLEYETNRVLLRTLHHPPPPSLALAQGKQPGTACHEDAHDGDPIPPRSPPPSDSAPISRRQWDSIHQQFAGQDVEPLHPPASWRRTKQLRVAGIVVEPPGRHRRRQTVPRRARNRKAGPRPRTKLRIRNCTAILTPDPKAKFDSLHHEMGHGPMEMHMRHPEPGSRD